MWRCWKLINCVCHGDFPDDDKEDEKVDDVKFTAVPERRESGFKSKSRTDNIPPEGRGLLPPPPVRRGRIKVNVNQEDLRLDLSGLRSPPNPPLRPGKGRSSLRKPKGDNFRSPLPELQKVTRRRSYSQDRPVLEPSSKSASQPNVLRSARPRRRHHYNESLPCLDDGLSSRQYAGPVDAIQKQADNPGQECDNQTRPTRTARRRKKKTYPIDDRDQKLQLSNTNDNKAGRPSERELLPRPSFHSAIGVEKRWANGPELPAPTASDRPRPQTGHFCQRSPSPVPLPPSVIGAFSAFHCFHLPFPSYVSQVPIGSLHQLPSETALTVSVTSSYPEMTQMSEVAPFVPGGPVSVMVETDTSANQPSMFPSEVVVPVHQVLVEEGTTPGLLVEGGTTPGVAGQESQTNKTEFLQTSEADSVVSASVIPAVADEATPLTTEETGHLAEPEEGLYCTEQPKNHDEQSLQKQREPGTEVTADVSQREVEMEPENQSFNCDDDADTNQPSTDLPQPQSTRGQTVQQSSGSEAVLIHPSVPQLSFPHVDEESSEEGDTTLTIQEEVPNSFSELPPLEQGDFGVEIRGHRRRSRLPSRIQGTAPVAYGEERKQPREGTSVSPTDLLPCTDHAKNTNRKLPHAEQNSPRVRSSFDSNMATKMETSLLGCGPYVLDPDGTEGPEVSEVVTISPSPPHMLYPERTFTASSRREDSSTNGRLPSSKSLYSGKTRRKRRSHSSILTPTLSSQLRTGAVVLTSPSQAAFRGHSHPVLFVSPRAAAPDLPTKVRVHRRVIPLKSDPPEVIKSSRSRRSSRVDSTSRDTSTPKTSAAFSAIPDEYPQWLAHESGGQPFPDQEMFNDPMPATGIGRSPPTQSIPDSRFDGITQSQSNSSLNDPPSNPASSRKPKSTRLGVENIPAGYDSLSPYKPYRRSKSGSAVPKLLKNDLLVKSLDLRRIQRVPERHPETTAVRVEKSSPRQTLPPDTRSTRLALVPKRNSAELYDGASSERSLSGRRSKMGSERQTVPRKTSSPRVTVHEADTPRMCSPGQRLSRRIVSSSSDIAPTHSPRFE